jgi:hypothetical protein
MKVFVYFNLHRKLFSVKSLEGPDKGKVIGHMYSVSLNDVTFKVSEAGRQRVLREKRKNVHAGVVGNISPNAWDDMLQDDPKQITYNPYRFSSFVDKDNLEPVRHAKYCLLNGRIISAWGVTA